MDILIVDDEIVSRKKLQKILETVGDCRAVESGETALDIATSENPPELILLDIMMPGMDGYEVCRKLKDDERTSGIPLIFISAQREEYDEAKGLELGAEDYIKKPYKPAIVKARVKAHLERKRAQEAVRDSEEKYRSLFNNSRDGIGIFCKNRRILDVNEKLVRLSGYSRKQLLSMELDDIYPVAVKPAIEEQIKKMSQGKDPDLFEISLRKKDGTEVPVEVGVTPLENCYGQRIVFQGSIRDITERKQAEEALRESQEAAEVLLNATTDSAMMQDINGTIVAANEAVSRVLGLQGEGLIGQCVYDFLPASLAQTRRERLDKVIGSGKPLRYEEECKGRYFDISVCPIFDGQGRVSQLAVFSHDITERKITEDRIRQMQKLEAIGTLAGGIAHDFNNLLMAVQGNASLMLCDTDSSHPHHTMLENIEKQIKSGVKLTKQLLGYARKGKYDVKPIDLGALVEETSEAFGRTKREIKIHREMDQDLLWMDGDQSQIEQVLLSLYVNAADAMPTGGELFLWTANVTDKDMQDKLYRPKPGNYIQLNVADTGAGMDRETQERVFDPFFTTKDMGTGTGLGLASTYGIVKGHGGYIDVDSEIGRGTTLSIYIPASERGVAEDVSEAQETVESNESVLLVDDEPMVLDVGMKMLKRLGYEVLQARGGNEAVEIFKSNKDDIGVVVLDMVMPDMGGREAYERLKRIDPQVRVLLSSGYSIEGQATEILERGCDGFIQKPFTIKELSQSVREVLEKE